MTEESDKLTTEAVVETPEGATQEQAQAEPTGEVDLKVLAERLAKIEAQNAELLKKNQEVSTINATLEKRFMEIGMQGVTQQPAQQAPDPLEAVNSEIAEAMKMAMDNPDESAKKLIRAQQIRDQIMEQRLARGMDINLQMNKRIDSIFASKPYLADAKPYIIGETQRLVQMGYDPLQALDFVEKQADGIFSKYEQVKNTAVVKPAELPRGSVGVTGTTPPPVRPTPEKILTVSEELDSFADQQRKKYSLTR